MEIVCVLPDAQTMQQKKMAVLPHPASAASSPALLVAMLLGILSMWTRKALALSVAASPSMPDRLLSVASIWRSAL